MMRVLGIGALIWELIKYLLSSRRRADGQYMSFGERLLQQLEARNVAEGVRPYVLGYAIVGGIKDAHYQTLFAALENFGEEVPWERMSLKLLRSVFEICIVADRLPIARRALNELSARRLLPAGDVQALARLIDWRMGHIRDESTIDLDVKYFVVYPAYDEYFRGRILFDSGRAAEAKQHFQNSLALAPSDAKEFREDVSRRLELIVAGTAGSSRTN